MIGDGYPVSICLMGGVNLVDRYRSVLRPRFMLENAVVIVIVTRLSKRVDQAVGRALISWPVALFCRRSSIHRLASVLVTSIVTVMLLLSIW